MKHFQTERGGEFVIEQHGNRAGEVAYTIIDKDKISIDHTFVEKPLRGIGLGKKLIAATAEFARKNGWKIKPLCPFAKAIMEQEYKDLIQN